MYFDGIPASDTVITLNTKTGSTVSPRAFYSYNSNSLYYDLPLAGSNALYGSPDLYANNVFNDSIMALSTWMKIPQHQPKVWSPTQPLPTTQVGW
jgi:hypothetical protein